MAAYSAGRGGKREGAGRKKGSVARKHAPIIADPDGLMPIDWLLAVLRDPLSEPGRRDAIAIAVMPYLHPRLAQTMVSGKVDGGGGDTVTNNTVNIFAVPRGASLDLKDGTVSIQGVATTELQALEPFEGTPALQDQPDTNQGNQPPSDPLPVHSVDTSNITRLKRPGEPGAMVQRVFDAIDKRDTRRADDSSDNGAA